MTCPVVGDNLRKWGLRPHTVGGSAESLKKAARRASARGAAGGVRGRLAGWRGKSPPRRRSVAGLRGRSATLGLRTAQTPTGGSSEGSSAMGASLTEQRRVGEDGLRVVNPFSAERAAFGRYGRKKPRLTTCQQPR